MPKGLYVSRITRTAFTAALCGQNLVSTVKYLHLRTDDLHLMQSIGSAYGPTLKTLCIGKLDLVHGNLKFIGFRGLETLIITKYDARHDRTMTRDIFDGNPLLRLIVLKQDPEHRFYFRRGASSKMLLTAPKCEMTSDDYENMTAPDFSALEPTIANELESHQVKTITKRLQSLHSLFPRRVSILLYKKKSSGLADLLDHSMKCDFISPGAVKRLVNEGKADLRKLSLFPLLAETPFRPAPSILFANTPSVFKAMIDLGADPLERDPAGNSVWTYAFADQRAWHAKNLEYLFGEALGSVTKRCSLQVRDTSPSFPSLTLLPL